MKFLAFKKLFAKTIVLDKDILYQTLENEIALGGFFPFLRWKAFHKSAFSVCFLKKQQQKNPSSRSKICSQAIIDFSVRKELWSLSQLSACCIFQGSCLFLVSFSLYIQKTRKNMKMSSETGVISLINFVWVDDIIWENLYAWLYYNLV